MQSPRILFKPVPLKARHDGWTPARQIHFIEGLDATKSLTKACSAVGMSRTSAYKLRGHPEARQFRLAWSAALRSDFESGTRRPGLRTKLTSHGQPTSSALSTLQTYLVQLRAQEDALGSAGEG